MCLCENGVEDNEHFLLHCQQFSIRPTSYLDNVSHLIKRSTTTLSDSLLCNILLFGDNQFNDIINKHILESAVDFVKEKLGDSSVFLICLMEIRETLTTLHLTAHFFVITSVPLFLTLPASCCCCCRILEILRLFQNTHSITVVTSWASNLACIAPSDFQMLVRVPLFIGVEIRGYDNINNWNLSVVTWSGMVSSDLITYVTCCHHLTL